MRRSGGLRPNCFPKKSSLTDLGNLLLLGDLMSHVKNHARGFQSSYVVDGMMDVVQRPVRTNV